jgi:L-ascorbate metabolism protein UlaG (beta-lactamase superfamily)
MKAPRSLIVALPFLAAMLLAAPRATDAAEIGVTWLGHATFEITSSGGTTLLLDPFLTNNPMTPADRKDLAGYQPDAILLSHSHFDHTGDAAAIAAGCEAKLIGTFGLVGGYDVADDRKLGGNVGGKFTVGDVIVHLVPAMHSSEPDGRPLGFVLEFADGRTLYFTGDTWIFGDMELIGEIYAPDIVLLQVGGGPYNQDPKTAALAVKKYLDPTVIIPMHYGTWPPLASEADVNAAFDGDARLKVLKPGVAVKL